MTNISTAGYKAETYADTTFDEVLISRVGNKDKRGAQVIGEESYILAPSRLYIDFTQGTVEETGLNLDFAIQGDGFFAIQTENGVLYTRNGSFSLDDEGYLTLAGQGRVLDVNGDPIFLPMDQIRADGYGTLYLQDGEAAIGRIGVYTFPDNDQLTIAAQGLFDAGEQQATVSNVPIQWKAVERANVDLVDEMTTMMSSQRALQGAAQVLKIYDSLLTKITTDVASV